MAGLKVKMIVLDSTGRSSAYHLPVATSSVFTPKYFARSLGYRARLISSKALQLVGDSNILGEI